MAGSKTILCTLGPCSLNPTTIERLGEMGVGLFRLNLSHTSVDQLEGLVKLIRENSDVPICLDSQGAQIRTGNIPGGSLSLRPGEMVQLTADSQNQSPRTLSIYPPTALKQLTVGDVISVDFAATPLQVVTIGPVCQARVLAEGTVGSNKAISVDRHIDLPALTDQDRAAFALCPQLNIDQIALSFTNRSSDIRLLRELAGDHTRIIAKVESRLGLENLVGILEAADAILIDRGDLAKEVPMGDLPFIQKEVIRQANEAEVPVYVATKLLESMVVNPGPTRAEANDVINTLLDGADGLVLAAETAVGRYPIGCVSMLRSFINQHRVRTAAPIGARLLVQDPTPGSSSLIEPYGGRLVNGVLTSYELTNLREMQCLDITEHQMLDVKQIALGSFSPLEGFMTSQTLRCVLEEKRLSDETSWPMPVLFQMQVSPQTGQYSPGNTVALFFQGEAQALLILEEAFRYDLEQLALGWFGTTSKDHPGVARLFESSPYFLAGKVQLLPHALEDRQPYELAPSQARSVFEHRRWEKVVGFHTRNVPHRAHEYLQFTTLDKHRCDGIFIHPVTGPKKSGDFSGEIILKAYDLLLDQVYPPNNAILGSFLTYPRYAALGKLSLPRFAAKTSVAPTLLWGETTPGSGSFILPMTPSGCSMKWKASA